MMKRTIALVLVLALVLLAAGCAKTPAPAPDPEPPAQTAPADHPLRLRLGYAQVPGQKVIAPQTSPGAAWACLIKKFSLLGSNRMMRKCHAVVFLLCRLNSGEKSISAMKL